MHQQGPFVYLCMAAGGSRDHFNYKAKSVLISSLQRFQDEGIMQLKPRHVWRIVPQEDAARPFSNHKLWN